MILNVDKDELDNFIEFINKKIDDCNKIINFKGMQAAGASINASYEKLSYKRLLELIEKNRNDILSLNIEQINYDYENYKYIKIIDIVYLFSNEPHYELDYKRIKDILIYEQ